MTSSSLLLALGVLSASFFGSWHCAGMCGPIATLMGARKSLLSYHIGRGTSYITLGWLAGYLGHFFISSEFSWLRWISAGLLAAILTLSGLNMIFPGKIPEIMRMTSLSHGLLRVIRRLQAFHLSRSGWSVGLLTALLPCGWLYTYVTAAVATQSPWAGALVMLLFWLGGLPALSAVPMMVRQAVSVAGLKQQKIAGAVLICAGLYSIVSFFYLH